MLRFRNELPFDYSLCQQTVTVYHREGLTRQLLSGVHFEQTVEESTEGAVTHRTHSFLLVVPFACDLKPGDKLVPGEGPEVTSWTDVEGYTARSVKKRTFMGRYCHTEVRA